MSISSSLLFDHCLWLLLLMPLLSAGTHRLHQRERSPTAENGKIYRHDVAARVEHWPHALGTLFLLISGDHHGIKLLLSALFQPVKKL